MTKRVSLILKVALGILFVHPLQGAQKLDLGAEYRLRGIQMNNPTYATEALVTKAHTTDAPFLPGKTIDERYYTQQARIYLKGKLDPGIEIASVIQALGVTGSTTPLLNRYPKEDFTPFVENIYVQGNEIFDLPVNLTVGRQPYVWGSGLLISDDGVGFDGIRLDAGPFWGVRTHLLSAKATDRRVGEGDRDLYLAGLSYVWGIHNIKFGWIWEKDRSGTPYTNIRSTTAVGSDNIARLVPVGSDSISRQYYDLQLSGRLEKGAYYTLEYAIQRGTVKIPGQDISLSGSALTFEGGFDFIHPRWKRMIIAFVFAQGSGDDAGTNDIDEKFNVSFGKKYDGLERVGHGDFFAMTPYSFFNEDKVILPAGTPAEGLAPKPQPLNTLYSGLRTFGFRGAAHPWDFFSAHLEAYAFSVREKPEAGKGHFTFSTDVGALGWELVIRGKYTYAKRINVGLHYGKLFAGKLLNEVGASRIIFEVSGKF